jgi:predicted N-acetyltransferase YhbS
MNVRITEVTAPATHDLRRTVLRNGDPKAEVEKPNDVLSGTFHLAAFDDAGLMIGAVSCSPTPHPKIAPNGWQMYQMGVLVESRLRGVGRALVEGVIDRLAGQRAPVLWAAARDYALPFYASLGFSIVGEQFRGWSNLPHHHVLKDVPAR